MALLCPRGLRKPRIEKPFSRVKTKNCSTTIPFVKMTVIRLHSSLYRSTYDQILHRPPDCVLLSFLSVLLRSTLFYCTLLFSTLLFTKCIIAPASQPYSLFYSTLLFSTLFFSVLLYSSLFSFLTLQSVSLISVTVCNPTLFS